MKALFWQTILEKEGNIMRKALAILVSPIAIVGMSLSLSGLASASADPSGQDTTGSSVGTVPQCAWHLTGVGASVTMTHGSDEKYNGENYPLTGSGASVASFVAPVEATSAPTSPQDNDCSWYNSKASAAVTISAGENPGFTSSSFEGDTSMNFALNDSSHKLTATVSPTCSSPWAGPTAGANDVYSGHLSGVATSLALSHTTTTSACSYTVQYAATVPGGKAPAHAGQNYAMVGPTLTTTLVTAE